MNPVAAKPKDPTPSKEGDPLNINGRLYNQIGKLLDDLEREDREEVMTTPQRISALIAVGRILTIFASLKKADYENGNTGSAVRKYAAAFARPDATGGRTSVPRHSLGLGGGDGDGSADEFDA
jgi:hypothetical protein